MKSGFPAAIVVVVFALAIFAGCRGNKPGEQPPAQEQPTASNGQPSTTAPSEEKPAVETTPKPPALPPLTVTPVKPNDPTALATKLAFAKMELATCPTFGLVYRTWVMALYTRDFEKAWNLLGPNARAKMDESRTATIQNMAMSAQGIRIMIPRGGFPPSQIPTMTEYANRMDAEAAALAQSDAHQYFTWVLEHYEKGSGKNPAEPYLANIHKFIAEEVKGETGLAKTDAKAPNDKLAFVRENGEWKIDFMPFPQEQTQSAVESLKP
jgi:hypothetical protein